MPVDIQNKSQTFEFFCSLLKYHNMDDKDSELNFLTSSMLKIIEKCKFFSGKPLSSFFDESLCHRLIIYFMKISPINAFATLRQYSTIDEEIIGRTIYPLSSFLNHSCYPNTGKFFVDGPKIIVYASRPIKKNEQLLDSYGPTYSTHIKTDRQLKLKKQYQFNCACEACENNWPIINQKFANSYFEKTRFKDYDGKLLDLQKKIKSIIKGRNESTFGHEKKSFEELCGIIDLTHSFLSSFEAAIAVNHWNSDAALNSALQQLYNVELGELSCCFK